MIKIKVRCREKWRSADEGRMERCCRKDLELIMEYLETLSAQSEKLIVQCFT